MRQSPHNTKPAIVRGSPPVRLTLNVSNKLPNELLKAALSRRPPPSQMLYRRRGFGRAPRVARQPIAARRNGGADPPNPPEFCRDLICGLAAGRLAGPGCGGGEMLRERPVSRQDGSHRPRITGFRSVRENKRIGPRQACREPSGNAIAGEIGCPRRTLGDLPDTDTGM